MEMTTTDFVRQPYYGLCSLNRISPADAEGFDAQFILGPASDPLVSHGNVRLRFSTQVNSAQQLNAPFGAVSHARLRHDTAMKPSNQRRVPIAFTNTAYDQ